MRVELRRAAGDVERRDAPPRQEREHEVDDLARHLLGAVRAGIDVAVHAGLVAAIADIDLQGIEPRRRRIAGNAIRSSSGQVSRMALSVASGRQAYTATRRRHAAPPTAHGQFRVSGLSYFAPAGRRDRGSVVEADAAEARHLHARMAQVETGNQPEEIQLDALDPADLDTPSRPQSEASTPVRLSVRPA